MVRGGVAGVLFGVWVEVLAPAHAREDKNGVVGVYRGTLHIEQPPP